jgi:hypothetical protein
VLELAQLVKRAGASQGYDVEIEHLENPRTEKEEHYYNAVHTKLLELGLAPHLLGQELVESILGTIARNKDRVIVDSIKPRTLWRPLTEPPVLTDHVDPPLENGRSRRFARGENGSSSLDDPLAADETR